MRPSVKQAFTEAQTAAMERYQKAFISELNNFDIVEILGLKKAKTSGYICPICHSGDGKNGTGAQITSDHRHITCYSKQCFGERGEDILGALRIITGKNIHEILTEHFPNYDITSALKGAHAPESAPAPVQRCTTTSHSTDEEPAADYSATLNAAYYANIQSGGEYLKGRGISLETQMRLKVGYVEQWKHPKAPENAPCFPVVIFAEDKSCYTARYTMSNAEIEKQIENKSITSKSPKTKGIKYAEAYGAAEAEKVLADKPTAIIYITEGETNCLSFWEIGEASIATGSASYTQKAVNFAANHPKAKYIIAFDNDKNGSGQAAAAKLKAKLDEIGVYNADFLSLSGMPYNDINDFLREDRAGLEAICRDIKGKVTAIKSLMGDMTAYKEYRERPKIQYSTSFYLIDEMLGGGIEESRLTLIGAKTHVCKTQLCVYIACEIAKKAPVIYYSLEMSRFEMLDRIFHVDKSADTDGILNNFYCIERRITENTVDGKTRFEANTTIEQIYANIKEAMNEFTQKPVVIIDYLQLITSNDDKAEQRIIMKNAVMMFNYLVKEYGLSIIVISSLANDDNDFNGTNYKESGDIGYTADTCIKLETAGNGKNINVHVNKNRQNGQMGIAYLWKDGLTLSCTDENGKAKSSTLGTNSAPRDEAQEAQEEQRRRIEEAKNKCKAIK